jgi:type II secretion system protein I
MIRARRGMTLLEVLVAVAVLATGVVALQRLLTRSVTAVSTDGELTRAMLLARALLAEAELTPPETGHVAGDLTAHGEAGFRFERDVTATPHPRLREVRIRVYPAAAADVPCELVELVRVPAS